MNQRTGVLCGLGAYLLWGAFPLYFPLLAPAGAVEVLVHRVLWSLVVCAVVLTAASAVRGWRGAGWAPVVALARSPRRVGLLAVAAVVIAVNWGVYIYATTSGHVVEASLGYFINPLVTVALAVLVLGERLRALQWVAIGAGAVGVVVLTVDHGRPPWIALLLAGSFGTYGLVKKLVGAGVGALTSLTAETLLLAPAALAVLVWLERTGRGTFGEDAPAHPLLLASAGVVTAVPLLLFAAAARRVPLTTTGLLQYLTPVLQFLLGVLVLGERVPASRWVGFVLVWAALAVLTADLLRAGRRPAALAGPHGSAAPAAAPEAAPAAAPAASMPVDRGEQQGLRR